LIVLIPDTDELARHEAALAREVPGHRFYTEPKERRRSDESVRVLAADRIQLAARRLEVQQTLADRQGAATLAARWSHLASDARLTVDRLRNPARIRARWFTRQVLNDAVRCSLLSLDRQLVELATVLASTCSEPGPELSDTVVADILLDTRGAIESREAALSAREPSGAEAERLSGRAFLGDQVEVEGLTYVVSSRLIWARGDRAVRLRCAEGELIVWRDAAGPTVVFESQGAVETPPEGQDIEVGGERYSLLWHALGVQQETHLRGRRETTLERWLFRDAAGTWLWVQSGQAGVESMRGTSAEAGDVVYV
jgi:hypothetical protein